MKSLSFEVTVTSPIDQQMITAHVVFDTIFLFDSLEHELVKWMEMTIVKKYVPLQNFSPDKIRNFNKKKTFEVYQILQP